MQAIISYILNNTNLMRKNKNAIKKKDFSVKHHWDKIRTKNQTNTFLSHTSKLITTSNNKICHFYKQSYPNYKTLTI